MIFGNFFTDDLALTSACHTLIYAPNAASF